MEDAGGTEWETKLWVEVGVSASHSALLCHKFFLGNIIRVVTMT